MTNESTTRSWASYNAILVTTFLAFVLLRFDSFDHIFEKFPPLFKSISMMGPAFLFCLLCLPLPIVMLVLAVRCRPRPYTVWIFLALQFAAFSLDLTYWGVGMRYVFALLLFSMVLLIEVNARKLPIAHLVAWVLSLFVTFAWYLAIICVCISAAV